jgi:uncharacterized peroxidase-related enzyme
MTGLNLSRKESAMSALPQIEPADATGAAAALLTQVQKTLGSVPNMTKAMANSPALLKGYLALSGALNGGTLPAAVRERLAIASAEYNRCEYCLSAHTYLGRNIAKLDDAELERARHAQSSDPHVAVLLALSDAIARGRGEVDETVLKTAREAGVTDAEIAEVVGNLALNILTNYFNVLADVDNDWPVVAPHQHT